ncbi:COBRA-like protein 1 [Salvia splendens]|uniref:COBRA-like protein 1 n=1 Tax=Salvia splendens TaxID=180675 RepID=UPI001C25E7DD|nr:COBRA-like protein 1 [Salvia splendens]
MLVSPDVGIPDYTDLGLHQRDAFPYAPDGPLSPVSFLPPGRRPTLVPRTRGRDCYDPLDPNGNITVTFDIFKYTHDGYVARVTIQNYYQYRHVEKPGWKLGWAWAKDEVIWAISGAIATKQGHCKPSTDVKPHCCSPHPLIVATTIEGGLLAAWAINPHTSYSSFDITIGNLDQNRTAYRPPLNLTLTAPTRGYTCGTLRDALPSISFVTGGLREEQVFRTWRSECTYSSYISSKVPICCVSLSTFYNPDITSCPSCSCGCRVADRSSYSCISEGAISSNVEDAEIVRCTDHMCPLRVHWHIKTNYVTHWRVKLTVSNYHYGRNYSDWNIVVQHPGFRAPFTAPEFNNTMLSTVPEDAALFWGKVLYNTELLQGNEYEVGSVTTDILMQKIADAFTLRNGWGFPRRIYFNGENCRMPLPDMFPMLPNGDSGSRGGLFLLKTLLYLTCTCIMWC